MKFFVVSVLLLALLMRHVQSANILVLSFFASKSHKLTYLPLIEELGKRGHNITLVSPVKPTKEMKNVKEIFTMNLDHIFSRLQRFDLKEKGKKPSPFEISQFIFETSQKTYELPQIQALMEQKFDLIFVHQVFNECVLGLAHKLNAPLVLFSPVTVPTLIANNVGAHFPSSIIPNFALGYSQEMTFTQRFINLGMNTLIETVYEQIYYPFAEKVYRTNLGENVPGIKEILGNASLVLSNGHFSLSGPKPYFPDIVDVGGIHCKPAKPIPKDLEDFIQKGKDGFILFSMGSIIKADTMSDEKRKLILNVFSRLKQQVLWKWESETMPDLPRNIKLSSWLPQQDLLGHKDIKMFISHCGGGSTEEAIYHGTPTLGIPMGGDQIQNAALAKRNGILIELDWNDLTEENLEAAINEILTNSEYSDKAKKLSTLFKDRPQQALELGVYWIEYVIRHHGAPHLRNAGRKLNAIQYHSLDVISAYLAIVVGLLYLICSILKFLIKKLCSAFQKKHSDSLANGKKFK